ncbi:SsgA family sporulation/cell division regulator [Streptomyces chartreusis]
MSCAELDCVLQLVAPSGRIIPVSARFSYRLWDPYSIHVEFSIAGRLPVSWVFARDLLAEGTVRPSGLGDVRIWPGGSLRSGFLCLELSSPDGRAVLTVPAEVVMPWLESTYRMVPAGREGASIDLESELSRLLGEVA